MSIFMVILVSSICLQAYGVTVRSWTTSPQYLPVEQDIDQMIDLACMITLVNSHIGDPFHGQLTAVKARHLLTSIT